MLYLGLCQIITKQLYFSEMEDAVIRNSQSMIFKQFVCMPDCV